MKHILILVLVFQSLNTFGQTKFAAKVKLSTGDCRNSELYPRHGADTISFYKLPEDTFAFKIIPRQYRTFPIQLDNIPASQYKLKYKNNFGQQVYKVVNITNEESNYITLCPDTLQSYPQNTLAKLQDGDTISINFHSQGCFHTDVLKLMLTKEADKFVARLYNVSWYYVKKKGKTSMQYRDGMVLKSATLTDKNIQDFIRFENELNYTSDVGCTTTDWYDIKSKYLNTKKTDGTCSWNGFYYLRKSFFGGKE